MKKVKTIEYIFIVIVSAILDLCFHRLTSQIADIPIEGKFSAMVKTLGLVPAVLLWVTIAFGGVAYVFYKHEDNLPGIKTKKGIRYGIAISLIWFLGMLEGVSLSGNTLIYESVMGLSDVMPVMVMGILLGKYTSECNTTKYEKTFVGSFKICLSLLIFSMVFLLGRYGFYYTKVIRSGYDVRPYYTFIWTLLMGTCIGFSYILIEKATKDSSAFLSALKFGVGIFAVVWGVFNIFIPIIFEGAMVEFIARVILDSGLVILSCYLTESITKAFQHRKQYKVEK